MARQENDKSHGHAQLSDGWKVFTIKAQVMKRHFLQLLVSLACLMMRRQQTVLTCDATWLSHGVQRVTVDLEEVWKTLSVYPRLQVTIKSLWNTKLFKKPNWRFYFALNTGRPLLTFFVILKHCLTHLQTWKEESFKTWRQINDYLHSFGVWRYISFKWHKKNIIYTFKVP